MKLSDLKIGQTGKIKKINLKGELKRKFMDMGILIGEKITVKKIAPLGDPLEITVKNYQLSIRIAQAQQIEMEDIA